MIKALMNWLPGFAPQQIRINLLARQLEEMRRAK